MCDGRRSWEDHLPGQVPLRSFQAEKLQMLSVVVRRYAPIVTMVAYLLRFYPPHQKQCFTASDGSDGDAEEDETG